MSTNPDVRLLLPNRAENVSLVRQALSGVALALEVDPDALAEIKTAVSEAANNVVVHAYDGGPGPLEVDVRVGDGELEVVVRDRGGGIQPHPVDQDAKVQGVGLALITALADRVEFVGGPGEGTEVHMAFGAPVDRAGVLVDSDEAPGWAGEKSAPDGDALISVCSGVLAGPVLASVVGAVAARTLSVERLADAQLVTDAIAAHGHDAFPDDYLHVSARAHGRELQLSVGPLVTGGGEALLRRSQMEGLGDTSLFERIADEVRVEPDDSGERLRLALAARD